MGQIISNYKGIGEGVYDNGKELRNYEMKCAMLGLYVPDLKKDRQGVAWCSTNINVRNVGKRELVVPPDTDYVTGIWHNTGISRLMVNGTGTNIDDNAFSYSSVNEMHIASKLGNIGVEGFSNSSLSGKLKAYKMGSIESRGFNGISTLKEVEVGGALRFIGLDGFSGCGITEVYSREMEEASQSLEIMEGVFKGCKNLKKVRIGINVSYLGSISFLGDSLLEEVDMPGVKETGNYIFCGCTELRRISLPGCIRAGKYIAEDCYELRVVELPSAVNITRDTLGKHCYIGTLIINNRYKGNEKSILSYGNIGNIIYK